MITFHLDKFLSGHVFGFVMIFSRIGSVIMLMPGIGETFVPVRSRLMLALAFSFLLLEPMLGRLPAPPDTIGGLVHSIGYEVIIGLFFGILLRLLMSVLEATGMVISIQSGLSNATILNPAIAGQSPLPSAFLAIVAITMIFVTGLDHMLFRGMVALYDIFPPNGDLMPGDMAQLIIQTVNKTFTVGIELAMPFFVIGLLMYIALGVMQKILPQVQLFLVILPVQVWGGLMLMALTTAGIITIWLRYFDSAVSAFVGAAGP
jgi:flagellar biosynthetic protein FliR